MTRHLKFVRTGRDVALVDVRQGKAFLALLFAEAILSALFLDKISELANSPLEWLPPVLLCVGVMGWTAAQIGSDLRLSIDQERRRATLVAISPLSGRRTIREFAIDEVESLTVRQRLPRSLGFDGQSSCEFVIELRDGDRLVLARRAPLFSCRETVARFASVTGLGTRVERLHV